MKKALAVIYLILLLSSQGIYAKQTYGNKIKEKLNYYNIQNKVIDIPKKEIENKFADYVNFSISEFGKASLVTDFITLNKLGEFEQTAGVGDGKTLLGRVLIGVNFFTNYYYATTPELKAKAWRDLGWNLTKEGVNYVTGLLGGTAALPGMFVAYILEESYAAIITKYEEKVYNGYNRYYSDRLLGKNIMVLVKKIKDGTVDSYLRDQILSDDGELADFVQKYVGGYYTSNKLVNMLKSSAYMNKFKSENYASFRMAAERASREIVQQRREEYRQKLTQELKKIKMKLAKQRLSLTGRIVNAVTKEGVDGVGIEIVSNRKKVYTDGEGRFVLEISLFDVYTDNTVALKMEKNGFLPGSFVFRSIGSEDNPEVEITIKPAIGAISGYTLTDKTGDPVKEVNLKLYSESVSGKKSVISGADGAYNFTEVMAGKYEILAQKIGYQPARISVTLPVPPKGKSETEVKKNINLVPANIVVIGEVVEGRKGQPLPGAEIKLKELNKNTVTDAAGTYSFNEIVPGEYGITASRIGYEDNSVNVTVPAPKDEEPLEIRAPKIKLQPFETQVKITSPCNGEKIEDLTPTITGIVRAEETIIPENSTQFFLDSVLQVIEYDSTSGNFSFTPVTDLEETAQNKGNHTARIIATLPTFGVDADPEVLQDTVKFKAGKSPVIDKFFVNEKHFENAEEYPLLLGSITDKESGIDMGSLTLTIDSEVQNPIYYAGNDGKNANMAYFPEGDFPGGQHTAVFSGKDMAGFEASRSLTFTTEGGEIIIVRGSIVIDDSAGNGDGKVGSGETVDIFVDLQNVGTKAVEGVKAFIYTDSQYVSIAQPRADYGLIEPGQKAFPQGEYAYFTVYAQDIGERENTEPIQVTMYVDIKDKSGKNTWTESFNLSIFPSFFVRIDRIASPVMEKIQTITGIVSDMSLPNATLILNDEARTIELYADAAEKMAKFSQKVSLKAEADNTNSIRVMAVNSHGEKAEDNMELVIEVPAIWARAVLTWNTRADIDLWVTDPSGEKIGYYHMRSAHDGTLDFDDINGFGPETFTQNQSFSGTYIVKVHYFGDTSGAYEDTPPPTSWQVRLTLFEGTENEENRTYSGTLGGTGAWQTVTTFTIPASSTASSPYGEMFSKAYEVYFLPGNESGYIDPVTLPQKK